MASLTRTFDTLFDGQRMMGIFRGMEPEACVELARRAWSLGISCVEVPLQDERSARALAAVVEAGREAGRHVGAGTVTSPELARRAAGLGAAFTVAPGLDAETARASRELGLPHLPGVATATEVQAAGRLGLTWVKAFPASVLGEGWFRAMRGPFPQLRFVATGGIDAGNAAAYLAAGAAVVAVGSALERPESVDALARVVAGPSGP